MPARHLRLRRISDEGLADAVRRPLRLAGERDKDALEALVQAVQHDISDQPSDLPLMQVALRAAWQEHAATGLPVLTAYETVGGVRGALKKEAEKVFNRLPMVDQERLGSIFVRLFVLATRAARPWRTALLEEFDEKRLDLVRRLGRDDHGRLLAVSATTAEMSHEALIIQWPWLQRALKAEANNVRRLDRLMEKAREWNEAATDRKQEYLAAGAELELFNQLEKQHPDSSIKDTDFVERCNEKRSKEQRQAALRMWALRVAVVCLACALVVLIFFYRREEQAKLEANSAATRATKSATLTVMADSEALKHPIYAAKLALDAWPRSTDDHTRLKLPLTADVLFQIVPNLRQHMAIDDVARLATFSKDGSRIVAASDHNVARLWDAVSGSVLVTFVGHENAVRSATFSPDGRRVVTASADRTARVWDATSGREIQTLAGHLGAVSYAAFSPNGRLIVTASDDQTARVWDAEFWGGGRDV